MKGKNLISPVYIPTEKLRPFEGHPYKIIDDDRMTELTESIRENGILVPLAVRPLEGTTDEYEIISGHRRWYAAQKIGKPALLSFVFNVTHDEAAVMLVDSNMQRERILPSEKAFAYKLKLDALSRQGSRTDLTSSQTATRLDTAKEVGSAYGESRDTVYRYVRLTKLIPAFLDLMDEGRIAFSVGVELSFLDDDLQRAVLEACELNDCTPSYFQAVRMHKAANAGTLDRDGISEIMSEEKANQRDKVRIPVDVLKGKVPESYSEKQRQEFVVKAIEYYHRHLVRQRESAR